MSRLKSGAILLLLAIPFFAYGAWQALGASRVDMIASEPPPDKGSPSKEQIAAAKANTEKWIGDIKKDEAVAFQFRQPGASDNPSDDDCKTLIKWVAARAADLNDLDKFLSEVASPRYEGALKSRYEEWQASKEKVGEAENAIKDWFNSSQAGIDSPESAKAAVAGFQQLLNNYTKDSRFFDPAKAATWKVQCRLEIIKSLEGTAKGPYEKVLELPLPLPSESESQDVKKALGAPRAIRDQVRLMKTELSQSEDAHINLPSRTLSEVKEAIRRSDEWAVKEELLTLFADTEPLTNPSKAGDWLAKVATQYAKTQTDAGRSLIRKKVQQFCAVFVPRAAKLDATVLIKDEEIGRKGVSIEYDSDAKTKSLSDNPDDEDPNPNEFNFKSRYLNFYRIIWASGAQYTGTASVLQPTPKSVVARDFTLARRGVTTWSVKELTELKKKCEGEDKKVEEQMVRRRLMDELMGRAPSGKSDGDMRIKDLTKIWTRITVLLDAMEKFPTLFESGS